MRLWLLGCHVYDRCGIRLKTLAQSKWSDLDEILHIFSLGEYMRLFFQFFSKYSKTKNFASNLYLRAQALLFLHFLIVDKCYRYFTLRNLFQLVDNSFPAKVLMSCFVFPTLASILLAEFHFDMITFDSMI